MAKNIIYKIKVEQMSDLLTIQLRLKKWSKIFLDQNYEHLF